MQVIGRRYDTGRPVAVDIEKGRIARIAPCGGRDAPGGKRLAEMPWLAPGFVDLQVNGYGGQEFNDAGLSVDKVVQLSLAMDKDGLTSYLPTVTTHHFERLAHVLATIAQARDWSTEVARRVPGIHLEGPYLSAEDGPRGAHPRQYCRPPDWNEFQRLQQAAGGLILVLTMSPEYEGSAEFIAKAVASGVVVAIGHTSAGAEQIRAAVDAGARMSTHLGNGAHALLPRHHNYIWDQLAEDRLIASLIVDGHHLPAEVLKVFIRAKGHSRCILVSDITGMGGMPPGRYDLSALGRLDVEVLDSGRVVVAGQQELLAGAALPITHAIANVMRFAEIDLQNAVEMASVRPAQLIGHQSGLLEVGSPAQLVQFDLPQGPTEPLHVRATINGGERVFPS